MKIVHLTAVGGSRGGGASLATARLHTALTDSGIDSTVLAGQIHGAIGRRTFIASSSHIWGTQRRWVAQKAEGALRKLATSKEGNFYSSGLVGSPVLSHPLLQAADLIVLYWIGAGFLSSNQIGSLLETGKPIVWRLSDMWAFTGGCHYAGPCEHYQKTCGRCPQLATGVAYDLAWLGQRQKRRWLLDNLTIITPSQWMAHRAKSSAVLGAANIQVIPTGVDVSVFRPQDRNLARSQLQIPLDRSVVLFGADGGTQNKRKGGDLLPAIMEQMRNCCPELKIFAVRFGGPRGEQGADFLDLGRVSDPEILSAAFAAADLFLAPYREDNLPNTILEALASGVPVCAFDIGGVSDAVIDDCSGRLVPPFDVNAFASAAGDLLRSPSQQRQLSEGARNLALQRFDSKRQAQAYISLFENLLHKS